jgi:NTE family protein
VIICCSAGYGLRQDPPSQFIVARMLSVFSTLFEARAELLGSPAA